MSVISLGIVPIIAIFNTVFFINLCFDKCLIEDSTHFLVKDSDGKYNQCLSVRQRFYDKEDTELKNCIYMGIENDNERDRDHIVCSI